MQVGIGTGGAKTHLIRMGEQKRPMEPWKQRRPLVGQLLNRLEVELRADLHLACAAAPSVTGNQSKVVVAIAARNTTSYGKTAPDHNLTLINP
jgi:hypothetical protein